AGRSRADFQISLPVFVVTGTNDEEMAKADRGVREQIGFYGSTPAYRGVLETHGWGELQDQLNALSKQGEWAEMGRRIDDDARGATPGRARVHRRRPWFRPPPRRLRAPVGPRRRTR